MRRYSSPTLRQKQRRIPKLPGSGDRGAPLPEPNWADRWEYVNTAERFEQPVIVRVPKPVPPTR